MTKTAVSKFYRMLRIFVLAFCLMASFAYAQQLEVELASPLAPTTRGQKAQITIQTLENASCTIKVHYNSGPSKGKGLIPKTADEKGHVSWTWRIGSRTTKGEWPILVKCSVAERSKTMITAITVK